MSFDRLKISKKRVFSGIQPSGNLHIGNFVGVLKQWVASQEEKDNIFCIVDLHAITVPQDPKELKGKIRELAGLYVAAGIDFQKSIIFVQSHIPAHTELAWILNCYTPIGWMLKMTQFKEKSENKESVSTGLLDYPALMAADILLYDTDEVPVGEDQKQHVELARNIAQRFNNIYGPTFKLPEAVVPKVGARIMGLDDPTVKMSKSNFKLGHAVHLLDSPEQIRAAFARATTDSLTEIRFDQSRPGLYNLLEIYEIFSGLTRPEIESKFADKNYSQLKEELAEVVIAGLKPLQDKYHQLMGDPGTLEKILAEGAEKARQIAEPKLREVKNKIGLG